MNATATQVEVRERPILFSGPMVRAILEGRKTQTRRVLKPQPKPKDALPGMTEDIWYWQSPKLDAGYCHTNRSAMESLMLEVCPYGKTGDRLWVREALRWTDWWVYDSDKTYVDPDRVPRKANPSRSYLTPFLMPRWASRITLETTEIRVERLMDISDDDIRAEGIDVVDDGTGNVRAAWANGWNAINEKRGFSWLHNPWVWVIHFRRT